MKKRLVLLFLLIANLYCIQAEEAKILFINTPNIAIGAKELKTGDTFDTKEIINWVSDKQAMKVLLTKSKKQKLVTARQLKSANSIFDYFSKTHQLSTRGDGLMDFDGLKEMFKDTLLLLDSIRIESAIETTSDNYFYIKYQINNSSYQSNISQNGAILIDPSIYKDVKAAKIPEFLNASIYFHDSEEAEDELLTDQVVIQNIEKKISR